MGRAFVLFALAVSACFAQAAYFAQDTRHLEFENEWARISRVTCPPFGKSKTHAHPAAPTSFVSTTDGNRVRFLHDERYSIDQPAVEAGDIRFNRGMVERHEVKSLSEIPSAYLRVELKTEPLELPPDDIRIPPLEDQGFENAQIRIEKLTCEPHAKCPSRTRLP